MVCLLASLAQGQTPVGQWTFGQIAGDQTPDVSGHGHPASLINGMGRVSTPVGAGLSATASKRQYVSIPAIDLSHTTGETVTLWVNRTYSTSGGTTLLEAPGDYSRSSTGFTVSPDDGACQGILVGLRGDTGYTTNCYGQPSSEVWHHLAFVFDKTQTGGNSVAFYVDGKLQNPTRSLQASTNTNGFGNEPIYLFSRGGVSQFSSGAIADLRIFDAALSAEQIEAIYASGGLNSLSVLPANASVAQGADVQLTAIGTYRDGNTRDLSGLVNWTASPSTVASVAAKGLTTGVAIGSAAINASLGNVIGSTVLSVTQSANQQASGLLAGIPLQNWQQVFNFRSTSDYVADPVNSTHVLSNTVYPTKMGSFTYGWQQAVNAADLTQQYDPRLAGISLLANGTPTAFYVDLPSPGVYSVNLAMGSATSSQCQLAYCQVQLLDGNNVLATIAATGVSAGTFVDATGTQWTADDWPDNNLPQQVTVTGTRLTALVGSSQASGQTPLASLGLILITPRSFSISASPSSVTLTQGNTGSSTVTTTLTGGFNGAITLSASGMPAGTTVSFAPNPIPAPGSGSSTMTINVGANTAVGSYPITVSGISATCQYSTTMTLTVTAPANYTISASPSVVSVVQGNQGSSTITTAISGAFKSAITLSASGVPTGTSVSFAPNPIAAPGSGSSTMSIRVGANTALGTYPITVTGNGGGIQHSTTVTLTVIAPPDYIISASPSTVSVVQGSQGSSTVTTAISGGFNSAITLSASGVPTGTTVSFAPNPIAAPGNGSSAMTISVGANTAVGTYTITVSGTGGGVQHSTTVTLTVTGKGGITLDGNVHGVQDSGSNSTNTESVSIGTPTAGDLITCEVTFDSGNSNALASVSDNNNGTYAAAVPAHLNTNRAQWFGIYYKENVSGSATTVTLKTTKAQAWVAIACQAWKGVATSNSLDPGFGQLQDGASAPNPTTGSNKTPATSGELVIASVGLRNSGAPTPGSNYTMIDGASVTKWWPEYWIQTTASATAGNYTWPTDAWTDMMAAFLPIAAGNFAVSASPSSLSVVQGSQGTSTITTTISGGFNNAITLSASGVPTGTTVSFNPNPITAPGNGASTMTINVGSTTAVGIYPITVTGNGGGIQQSTTVTLTVTAQQQPDFTISASPTSLTVMQGNQGSSTITTAISGGFNGAITLSASGVPTGTTVSFSPNPIAAPGNGSSAMTINVGSTTALGTYPITVTGNGGGVQHSTTVTLTVTDPPDYTITANPSTVSVVQGNQGSSTVTTTIIGAFNSAITLSASGVPTGTTVSFNPNPIAAPGNGSSAMTISVGSTTAVGTYPITVTGNGGSVQHTTTVTLTVTAPANYTISANPSAVSVVQGNQGSSTITTAISGGFNSAITLSASGVPTGTTVSFSPNPIAAPGNGSSAMTINVGSTTAVGTYPITVTGNGGSVQHTTTVTLTVTAPANYTISANPSAVSVVQGNQGSSTITTAISGGFNSAITLSAGGVPTGTTVSFSPNPIAAPGNGSSAMTISVGSTTAVGTYPITVTGNGGGIQQSTTVTLTVTAQQQPDFAISVSPTSVSVVQGGQGSSTVTTAISGGFNSAITLSASGVPTGTTVSFSPNPIAAPGNGSSTMTISVGANTAVGTYAITVSGTGAGVQHSTTVTLTVTTATTITFVQQNYATPQSPQTTVNVTYTGAQTAGDLNVVVVGWNDSTATVSSVTDAKGNVYSRAVGPTVVSGSLSQSIYYAQNIVAAGAGTNTVTVKFSSAAVSPDIRILEYSGADANNPVDVTAAGSGNSTSSSSGAATTTNPTDLIFGANIVYTLTTGPGSGFTSRMITSPDGDIAEDQMVSATGSYSATAPISPSGQWIMQMVAFRTPSVQGNFTLSASPTSLSITQGGHGTSTLTTTISGGFNSAITLSASGVPTGTTVSFNPNPIPAPGNGTSTMTIVVGANTAVGTYPLTVTSSGGGIQHSTTVTLTVTAGTSFSISASPTTLSLLQGSQGTSTITTAISGGFNSAISLTASGVPSGTIVSFSPNPIPAPGNGSSIMTITVGMNTLQGTYPIVITGSGNGVQQSVTLTITVTADVMLSWDASGSQGVIGYNVYRGTTTGGPYTKVNQGLVATTNYVDGAVQDGYTYYYVTTAVNQQQQESGYSNEASASVP